MSHSRQASITSSVNSHHSHPQKIGPWKLGKTLGRGATGRVLLATHHRTGQKAAVKVVSKSELQDDGTHKKSSEDGLPYGIEREIIIMKLLTHPNVLRLYDVWETSKALYLVLEYVEGGELFDLLVERGPLQEPEAVKYFRQIVLGTAYCHALGICHRDLKPENLLLDTNLSVKLADFGMAALESNGKLLETSCGSPHYAAPEIVSGLKYHGAASDIWSCGVILFALLTGRLPFDDENIRSLLLKVQAGNFEMPTEISGEAQDLIDQMLTVDPLKRIQTDKILQHPLLLKYPIPSEDLISVKSLPHPETAQKSLGSAKNIDPQILANLSILWHDRPEDEIVHALLINGPTPEKTFYALLMRYRHDQESGSSYNSPKKSTSFNTKRGMVRSNSVSTKTTPKRRSQITVSRPSSFQYKNTSANSTNNRLSYMNNNTYGNGRVSNASSVQNSPRKSPKKYTYGQSPGRSPGKSPIKSPRKSPRKYYQYPEHENSPPPAIPRNIYNEIVNAQNNGTAPAMAPAVPANDSYLHQYNYQASPEKLQSAKKEQREAPAPPAHQVTQALQSSPEMANINPIVDEISSQDLMASANFQTLAKDIKEEVVTSPTKRSSVMKKSNSKNRLSTRKSLRSSMTIGLKRNSITMKLLSTYAKLSGETDWEYMDKQTKRTSATFATLCDKIFNQEDYDEDEQNLVDEEEKQSREYERLMEVERKKHEAEYIARKELEKRKKRQRRKSLFSSKKLSILIRDDENNSEVDLAADDTTLYQPKRKLEYPLRSVSEGGKKEFTKAEIEGLKKRSVTEPKARLNPIVTRRPVSRLDPLWTAYENEQLTRAKDALEAEFGSKNRKKKTNRESAVIKTRERDGYERELQYRDSQYRDNHSQYTRRESQNRDRDSQYRDHRDSQYRDRDSQYRDHRDSQYRDRDSQYRDEYRDSHRESQYSKQDRTSQYGDSRHRRGTSERRISKVDYDRKYKIPAPELENTDLSDDYMSAIRKSRLLNSQLNMRANNAGDREENSRRKTLISDVKIPTVTRKSRHFSNSNKRLSVLTMYSTKESYRDLNSILSADAPAHNHLAAIDGADDEERQALRTSFADRLDQAGLPEDDDEEEPLDQGSVMDFEEHVANKRNSTYSFAGSVASKAYHRYTPSGKSRSNQRPSSQLPHLPDEDENDETFATKNDEVHRKGNRQTSKTLTLDDESDVNDTDVFDRIKLPDGKSSLSSVEGKHADKTPPPPPHTVQPKTKSMLPAEVLPVPNVDNIVPPTTQTYPKVRNNATTANKQPLLDATNKPDIPQGKRKTSIFRKLSWGSKKAFEEVEPAAASTKTGSSSASVAGAINQAGFVLATPGGGPVPASLPTPAASRSSSVEEKPRSNSFFNWFSSSSSSESEVKRYSTILPKQEMTTALFALLNSWSNFGLKNLINDQVGYNITGAISSNNAFNLKSCKFRIKVNQREQGQKSELVCVRVKGSKVTTDTLFKEIEKVLRKEGVLDN